MNSLYLRSLFLSMTILLGAVVLSAGCNGPEQPQRVALNAKLIKILSGQPVKVPVWASPTELYVYTGLISGSTVISGIFKITIDPSTLNLLSSAPNNFPHNIWNLAYDPIQGRLITIYSDASGLHVAVVHLANQEVVIDEEVVGPPWQPRGVATWPGKDGLVFYGVRPGDSAQGFYWRHRNSPDSLLLAVTLSEKEARNMAIDSNGHYLYFASGAQPVTFYSLDLSQASSQPTVIAQRGGGSGAILPHPTNQDRMLLSYFRAGDATNPPQGHMELFDAVTTMGIDLDVRTHPFLSRFTTNDHPSWSPDGHHFAFAAAAFDGEQGSYPPELWIYRDVP